MRALLILLGCCGLAAAWGCGKSEADSDADVGGAGASQAGGQAHGGAQSGGAAGASAHGGGGVAGTAAAGGAHGGSAAAGAGGTGDSSGGAAIGGGPPGDMAGGQSGGGAPDPGGAGGSPSTELVDCDPSGALCRSLPPDCSGMQVPSIAGTCWGPCVDITSCACVVARQCPDQNQYTCWSRKHCGPYLN